MIQLKWRRICFFIVSQNEQGAQTERIQKFLFYETAAGNIAPPLEIFSYIRPRRALVKSMSDNWILCKTKTGWITSDVCLESIVNWFCSQQM